MKDDEELTKLQAIEDIREAIVSNFITELKERANQSDHSHLEVALLTSSGITMLKLYNGELIEVDHYMCLDVINPEDLLKYP